VDQTVRRGNIWTEPRAMDVAASVFVVLLTVWMSFQASKTVDPMQSDTTADWITAKAAQSNLSLSRDIRDLGAALGVDYQSPGAGDQGGTIVNPRSPAAVLILMPLTLAEPESVHWIVMILNVASFLAMSLWITPLLCGVSVRKFVVPLAAMTSTFSFHEMLHWGGVSGMVALLTVASWHLSSSAASGGTWVGIATAFKLYPGLTLVPLVARPSRASAGWVAASVFLGLNLVGAMVTGISLLDSVELLFQAGSTWLASAGNQSLPGLLMRGGFPVLVVPAIVLAGIAWVWIVSRHRPFDQAMALSVALAVVISPLSWGNYDILVMPVVLMLWTLRNRWAPFGYVSLGWIIGNAGIGIVAAFGQLDQFFWVLLVTRIAIVLTITLSPARVWSRERFFAGPAAT
jgi:hypothetical protein